MDRAPARRRSGPGRWPELPIEPHVPRLVESLGRHGALVLTAEPGAGKTTRLPAALLEAPWRRGGRIWVVEPRRIAARLAARFVAGALGEEVGERVGYRVRFERAESRRTELLYLTDGTALRALAADPTLDGLDAIVLDEVHERRLETDVLLALLLARRQQRGPSPRLLVMSATMDTEALAAWLGAPVERIEGRTHPVEVRHAPRTDPRPVEVRAAEAVDRALEAEPDGDVLAFLPGVPEIERTARRLQATVARRNVSLHVLHGRLSAEAQQRALRAGERRKVVLSTAVAETSVTVQGVTVVIDAGRTRRARRDPWTGLQRLVTVPSARATAVQRAGRAGRLRPGRCLRLFTEAELRERPEHEPAAIADADLTDVVLLLRTMGEQPAELPWLQPPPTSALQEAERLLRRLGALDDHGTPTDLGRRMLRLPLPARLARVLLEARLRGCATRACRLVAWLAEHDGGSGHRVPDVDLLEVVRRIETGPEHRRGRLAMAVRRLATLTDADIEPTVPLHEEAEDLAAALLSGYPDRLARRLDSRGTRLALVDGGQARLADPEAFPDSRWLVVAGARDVARGAPLVTAAIALEPETVLDVLGEQLDEHDTIEVGPPPRGAAERVLALRVGQLVLDESRRPAEPGPATTEALRRTADGWPLRNLLPDEERYEHLKRRVHFARGIDPGIPALDESVVRIQVRKLCDGARSLEEVRAADPLTCLLFEWPAEARASLERLAPESVQLPGRRRPVPVHYEPDRPPWLAAPIQAFFGMAEGPRVGAGEVALVLHLLAPNGRAVQVTDDLAGFWQRLYPQVRRELARRYPKHAWPLDPLRPPSRR